MQGSFGYVKQVMPLCQRHALHVTTQLHGLVRDQPIMLIFSPIMLCSSAQNFHLLCSILYAHVKD